MKKYMETIRNLLKGFWIGSTMTVPGVSGGTMAMVVSCYDQMITAVSQFFKQPIASIRFLIPIAIGALAGIYLVSGFISDVLLVQFPYMTRYFFLGAVCGSVPMLLGKVLGENSGESGKKPDKGKLLRGVPYLLIGILCVLLLGLLPGGVFSGEGSGLMVVILRFISGIIIAAALVLPGISTSQMLWMLGMYEPLLKAVSSMDIGFLIPVGIGGVLGTFTVARVLDHLFAKHEAKTWFVILGFVAASLLELFPGLPPVTQLPGCVVSFAAGTVILYIICKYSEK